ncbi:restriction endonuclease subunit S [Staphylococcus sp. 11511212]|uniref:restriction endonuclease subunit S n=1 Tax=Staphylococcus sp. 11511212 TaxID=2714544 RepID=UPI001403BF1B|nr:restriction endonuclease subunit S [Staphylococcus sp. 11511212]NHM76229.1 restriction endonuclease subunit S [Staphylococcus sp. 11511212]
MTNEQKNLPELRFPEFDGEWEEKKLSTILEIGTGKSKVQSNESGKYNILGSTGIIGKSHTYDYEGDFILTARVGHYAGKLYKHAGKVNISDNTIYLYNFINKNFIYESLNVFKLEKLVFGSGQPLIKASDLKKLKIRVPVSKEQKKIGTFFSKLDQQIELEEKKLELLEQQKRGYMQKIFSQELKFKNSQLENIKWSYKTLEELNSFFTDGNYGESYPKSEDMSDKNDGVAFLRGSNLKKGRITLEDANYISKKKHSELTTGHLFLDDIVIAVRGSLGAVGYVNENMVGNNINSQLAIIRTSNSLLYGKYLLYYLMSNQGKKELLSRVTGTALKQLPIKQIKQIKVPVPKLHEQHKIANFLSELDNLIDNQTEKIELLKQRKQGLLQKMFV